MISEKMKRLAENNSVIRAMFEEGQQMAKAYGAENVFDFSLGNPSVPAPSQVQTAIEDVLAQEDSMVVHGYMSNAGFESVRQAIAEHLNKTHGTDHELRRRSDGGFSQHRNLPAQSPGVRPENHPQDQSCDCQ